MLNHAPAAGTPAFSARTVSPERGLERAALHELYAASEADASAMTAAGLTFARLAMGAKSIFWIRQALLDREAGVPYAPGLAELGLDPDRLTLVRVRDAQAALQAGLEAARCAMLGAVVVELWGEPKALDLTASRRLALAAKASGTPVLMTRIAASPQPSAAQTRWLVRGGRSRALAANAPGHPAFSLTLLRHRSGPLSGEWHLEWNRDHGCFEERPAEPILPPSRQGPPLSGTVVPMSGDRSGTEDGGREPPRKRA